MKKLTTIFLKGLLTLLPIWATIYLVYWLAVSTESFLGRLIQKFLPPESYLPGMGTAAGILAVLGFGLLLQAWLFRVLVGRFEDLLARVPLVKSLYSSIKDLLGFFGGGDKAAGHQVVLVALGEPAVELVGFVTRSDFGGLPAAMGAGDRVAVYLPMSYQIGGFTVLVSREALKPLDMTMEEALRFAVTAGMTADQGTGAGDGR